MNNQTQQHPIRLVLLDEHGLFRAGLGRFLASEPDFQIVGECGTYVEALDVVSRSPVEVVLLDFGLGTEQGSDFIRAARQCGYQGRFLIVTGVLDPQKSALVLKLGASGVFLKSEPPERLIQAIRLIADGETWVDPRIIQLFASELVERSPGAEGLRLNRALDDRERNVLIGILGGLSNRDIADNSGLSEKAIKGIVQRLFRKAGVNTRSQLVRVALEESWVPDETSVARRQQLHS